MGAQYQDSAFKWVWICGYWAFWFMALVFAFLAIAFEGWLAMSCTFFLFYLLLSVGNRGLIKQYYQINSSHFIFDMCAWTFCCACATVQEAKQSEQGIDLKVAQKVQMNKMEKAVSNSLHSAPSAPVDLEDDKSGSVNGDIEEEPMKAAENEEEEPAPAAFEE